MLTRHAPHDGELTLSDMLADPIVQAVMARDGVTRADVEGLMRTIILGRSRARIEPDRANRHVATGMVFAN